MQVKQLVGDQPATEWIEYYQRIHGSNYIRAEASGGDYSYDYSQASKARYVIKSSGGNASQDVEAWGQEHHGRQPFHLDPDQLHDEG